MSANCEQTACLQSAIATVAVPGQPTRAFCKDHVRAVIDSEDSYVITAGQFVHPAFGIAPPLPKRRLFEQQFKPIGVWP